MGRILIGGTAALLICIFLSPKFIEFLRRREFGQQIREDGPQGHHQKAGTPTMGGVIIFIAISVPFLILTDYDWRSVGVFGAMIACALLGFADDYTKLVKRRSLGLRGRTKLIVTIAISLGLWWVARPRRRDRGAGGDDQDGAAAGAARRDLRDRGAVGRDPGDLISDDAKTRVLDGADPPPLRAARVWRDEDHPSLLDRRGDLLRDRLHDLSPEHRLGEAPTADPRRPVPDRRPRALGCGRRTR